MATKKVVVGTPVRVVEGDFVGQRGVVIDTRASGVLLGVNLLEIRSNIGGKFYTHDINVVVDNAPIAPVQKPAVYTTPVAPVRKPVVVDTTAFEAIMKGVFPGSKSALFDAP